MKSLYPVLAVVSLDRRRVCLRRVTARAGCRVDRRDTLPGTDATILPSERGA